MSSAYTPIFGGCGLLGSKNFDIFPFKLGSMSGLGLHTFPYD